MRTLAALATGAILITAFIVMRYLRSRRVVVLGREVAAAAAAERLRLQRPSLGPSPIPATSYDVWNGELQLWNLQQVPRDSALLDAVRGLAGEPPDVRDRARARISTERVIHAVAVQ